MIGLTHDEAVTVTLTKQAIQAMNDLVVHLQGSGAGTLPAATRGRIVEADYLLNSAEDDYINDDPEMLVR